MAKPFWSGLFFGSIAIERLLRYRLNAELSDVDKWLNKKHV
jgi:hypothetical protein